MSGLILLRGGVDVPGQPEIREKGVQAWVGFDVSLGVLDRGMIDGDSGAVSFFIEFDDVIKGDSIALDNECLVGELLVWQSGQDVNEEAGNVFPSGEWDLPSIKNVSFRALRLKYSLRDRDLHAANLPDYCPRQ